MTRLLLTAALFISSLGAHADGIHVTGGIYGNALDFGDTHQSRLLNDLRIGWGMDRGKNRLALLLMVESDVTNETQVERQTRSAQGLSLALYLDQLYMIATWVADTTIEGAGRVGESEGQGYRLDLGQNFAVTSTLSVGPRFIYREYSYENDELGQNLFRAFEPTFSFAFKF